VIEGNPRLRNTVDPLGIKGSEVNQDPSAIVHVSSDDFNVSTEESEVIVHLTLVPFFLLGSCGVGFKTLNEYHRIKLK